MTDDTLRGYSLVGAINGDVAVVCDRCHQTVTESAPDASDALPLLDAVRAAVEHSGRCLE